ncbi:MAG: hypothetical protein D4R65_01610 [Verrucomicrobiaceae bacterium]|nr:MAG: hypothetical protein D4R65_01610 [Verrucomicrobiaceae bacterium]
MHSRPRALFRSSSLALLFFAAGSAHGFSQDPMEIWKDGSAADISQIAAARAKSPAELRPFFDLATAYDKAMRNAPLSEWRPAVQKLATQPDANAALKEAALIWEARARMAEFRLLLLDYYKKKASFPASLAPIAEKIPTELKSDPWGQPWQYQAVAPAHFPNLPAQGFKLVPSKYPGLQPIAELSVTGFTPPALTVGPANVANAMRVAVEGGQPVILQEGLTSRNIGLLKVTPAGSLWAVDGFLIFKAKN